MPGSIYDQIPGCNAAVARETVGRDAAYLRLPRLVAGVTLRPLTLRDYLRLSAAGSPFVDGGKADREHVANLLWDQRANPDPADDPQAFAARFDAHDLDFLSASCGAFVAEAMADAPGGGGRQASYYGLGALLIHALRREYHCSQEEVLDTPLDELWQSFRVIQHGRGAVLFNPSDRLKGAWLKQRNEPPPPAPAQAPRKRGKA